MKSLRLRLAFLTTVISGIVLIGFGLAGWGLTYRILRESIDLRLSVPLDRTASNLHPRLDPGRIAEDLEITGDDVDEGERLILVMGRDGEEVLRLPESDWVEKLDPGILRRQPPAPPAGQGREGEPPPGPPDENGEAQPGEQRPPPPPLENPPGPEMTANDVGPGGEAMDPLDRLLDALPPVPAAVDRKRPLEGTLDDPQATPPIRDRAHPPVMEFETVTLDGVNWRLGIIYDRGFRVLMATELSQFESELRRVRNLFLYALPVCLLLIGVGGWFVARRGLRPVDLIADTASQVTARGLDLRIPDEALEYRELSHLVEVLNGMMERLETSFQHANRFSADVSHELKTPLAVMQASVQTALKEYCPGSPEEHHLITVSQEAERLKRITRSLMLLAQADAGRLPVRREPVALSEEVEALCEDAEILCEKSQLQLTKEVEPGLTMKTDAVLLRQALQNLVGNAVKYNRADGEVICRLFRRKPTGEIVFSIANTGSGIPEEDRERIFRRFYRVDRARSREVDGFGLGLNLAWEIIRAMGGELRLAESSDKITRFEVRWKPESDE